MIPQNRFQDLKVLKKKTNKERQRPTAVVTL